MDKKRLKEEFTLFRIMFGISAFTFGGGYVVIPMMRRYFVEGLRWITEQELLDIAAIAQSTPGAIAVNLSVLIGYRLDGKRGAVICCISTVLPPFIILSLISVFYQQFRSSKIISGILKGMEAGVAAIMVNLVIDMYRGICSDEGKMMICMAPAALFASLILQVNAMIIILSCGLLCLMKVWVSNRLEV